MIRIFLILTWLAIVPVAKGQIIVPKGSTTRYAGARYSFFITLLAGPSSAPVSYGILARFPDGSQRVYFLKEDVFLAHITAKIKSPANPQGINYLDTFGIKQETFSDLWKLKAGVYPFDGNDELGWGGKRLYPTPKQFSMLSSFGINKVEDYAVDDKIWQLLIKMQDVQWVAQYRNF